MYLIAITVRSSEMKQRIVSPGRWDVVKSPVTE
jgi:hypothetical protein